MAANGIRQRRRDWSKYPADPTDRQPRRRSLLRHQPAERPISRHEPACRSRRAHPNMRNGVEKKTLNAATATPAAITSSHKGTALPGSPTGKEKDGENAHSQEQSYGDYQDYETSVDQPGGAKIDPCGEKIHCSVEHVWTRNQNHAGANRYQPQVTNLGCSAPQAHQSCRRAKAAQKRLQKSVRAAPCQCATHNRSGCCADHDEHHCFQVVRSEDRRPSQQHLLLRRAVNNQVGAAGACAIVLMFSSAAAIGCRPTAQFSIADIAEATRSMFTPVGLPRSKKLDCQCHLRHAGSSSSSAQSSWLVDQPERQAVRPLEPFRESTARWCATHVRRRAQDRFVQNRAIRSHIDCRTLEIVTAVGVFRQRLRHGVSPTRSPSRICSRSTMPSN